MRTVGTADHCYYRRGHKRIYIAIQVVHCKLAEKAEMKKLFGGASDAKGDLQSAHELTNMDEESGEANGGDEQNGPILKKEENTQNPPEVSLRRLKCFASVTISVLHCNCWCCETLFNLSATGIYGEAAQNPSSDLAKVDAVLRNQNGDFPPI